VRTYYHRVHLGGVEPQALDVFQRLIVTGTMFLRTPVGGCWNMTRKSSKTRAQETVVAAGKSAAAGTKTLAGEFAHAAAAAAATAAARATAAPGMVFDKVATAIGAPSSRTKKKVAKKVTSKKRTTSKKKANIKKASRTSAKKKRL
jgi:hypothetical protein